MSVSKIRTMGAVLTFQRDLGNNTARCSFALKSGETVGISTGVSGRVGRDGPATGIGMMRWSSGTESTMEGGAGTEKVARAAARADMVWVGTSGGSHLFKRIQSWPNDVCNANVQI